MQPRFLFCAAACTALSLLPAARGQTITSVQFIGGGNAPLYSAGAYNYTAGAGMYAATNWNPELNTGNANTPQSLTVASGLMTSTGGSSSVGFSLTCGSAYYTDNAGSGFTTSPAYPGAGGVDSGPGDAFLFAGFAATGFFNTTPPVTLTLTGLNPLDNYTVLGYIAPFTAFGQNQLLSLSLTGGPIYYANTDGGVGTYVMADSTAIGNYVEFDDVTGAASQVFTLTSNNTSSEYVGLNGFQVVDIGPAAPEPSTTILAVAGLIGTFALVRRKRTATV